MDHKFSQIMGERLSKSKDQQDEEEFVQNDQKTTNDL